MLAAGHTRRKKILVSKAVHPESRDVLKTYAKGQYIDVVEIPYKNGVTDLEHLKAELADEDAAVLLSNIQTFLAKLSH